MNEYLNQSLVYLHSEDLTKANQEIESAQQLWEHAGKLINGYVNHEIIDTVEENLVRLNAHIKAQQIQQAKVIVKAIQFELNHLYECELPSLKNIF